MSRSQRRSWAAACRAVPAFLGLKEEQLTLLRGETRESQGPARATEWTRASASLNGEETDTCVASGRSEPWTDG